MNRKQSSTKRPPINTDQFFIDARALRKLAAQMLARQERLLDNMAKRDVKVDTELLSERLLARLRDRQRRTQDDLEAFRVEFDLFKTLDSQHHGTR
jgi:hypothetical protein